jgi:hypothetical protein
MDTAVQLEPALKRTARTLAVAAEKQLRGKLADADLPSADRQMLARLRKFQQ